MPTPISSWQQIPPEYRQRVKEALRHTLTLKERRRRWLWIGGIAAFLLIASIAWFLGYVQAAHLAMITFWLFFMIFEGFRRPAIEHRDARRFADAVRAVGLVPAEVPPYVTWKQRWQRFAPPSHGSIMRDWNWVRHRKQRVSQRIGRELMWRYREEMYRRRFRWLLPGILIILLIGYVSFAFLYSWFASNGPDAGPITQLVFKTLIVLPLVLMGTMLIAWPAFYFIHESWRPTWAALNILGSPTCMRCGEDLTQLPQHPCPKCGTQPNEEPAWNEPIRATYGPLETVTPQFIPDSQANQR